MKQCATCNQIVNDTESYCPRCGGRKFKAKTPAQQAQPQQQVEQTPETKGNAIRQKAQKQPKNSEPQAQERVQERQATRNNNNPNRRPPQAMKNNVADQEGFIANTDYDSTVTWKEYLFLHLWCLIPLVGVIIFLIKLFKLKGDVNAKPSMREYAKFQLIMFAAGMVICLLYFIIFGAIMGSIIGSMF